MPEKEYVYLENDPEVRNLLSKGYKLVQAIHMVHEQKKFQQIELMRQQRYQNLNNNNAVQSPESVSNLNFEDPVSIFIFYFCYFCYNFYFFLFNKYLLLFAL
jgi:hypothetical protein